LEEVVAAIGPVALVALLLAAAYGAFRALRSLRLRRRHPAGGPATAASPSPGGPD
jgi:hypothetical protein